MDRESIVHDYLMEAGTKSKSLSTARYAWCSVHLGVDFVPSSMTYEIRNEAEDGQVWRPAKDSDSAVIPPIPVNAGDCIPIYQSINFSKTFRLSFSAPQPEGAKYAIVGKT